VLPMENCVVLIRLDGAWHLSIKWNSSVLPWICSRVLEVSARDRGSNFLFLVEILDAEMNLVEWRAALSFQISRDRYRPSSTMSGADGGRSSSIAGVDDRGELDWPGFERLSFLFLT
jgi:hypothetical protein